jgi:hypothetical protein
MTISYTLASLLALTACSWTFTGLDNPIESSSIGEQKHTGGKNRARSADGIIFGGEHTPPSTPEKGEQTLSQDRTISPTAKHTLNLLLNWRRRGNISEDQKAQQLKKAAKTKFQEPDLDGIIDGLSKYVPDTELEKAAFVTVTEHGTLETEEQLKSEIVQLAEHYTTAEKPILDPKGLSSSQRSTSTPVIVDLTDSLRKLGQELENNFDNVKPVFSQGSEPIISTPQPAVASTQAALSVDSLEQKAEEIFATETTSVSQDTEEGTSENLIDLYESYLNIPVSPAISESKQEASTSANQDDQFVPEFTQSPIEYASLQSNSINAEKATLEPQLPQQLPTDLSAPSTSSAFSSPVEPFATVSNTSDTVLAPSTHIENTTEHLSEPAVISSTTTTTPVANTLSSTPLEPASSRVQPISTTPSVSHLQSAGQPLSAPITATPSSTGPEVSTTSSASTTPTGSSIPTKPTTGATNVLPKVGTEPDKNKPTKKAAFFIPRKFLALGILGLTVATLLAYKKFYMTSKQQDTASAA